MTAVGLDVVVASPRGRQVSIDWFEATVKELGTSDLFGLLSTHLGEEFGHEGFDVERDDHARFKATGPFGSMVRADRLGQANRHGEVEAWSGVKLPGKACRIVGTEKLLALADAMAAAGRMKVSRLDVALDDFDKSVSPEAFAKACVVGSLADTASVLGPQCVTRVRRDSWDWSRRKGGCIWIGGKSAPRLLRVYDKDADSRGEIPSTRFELQCRDEFATELACQILQAWRSGAGITGVFLGHLVGFFDLRQPDGERSRSQDWPRAPMWAAVVGDVTAITVDADVDGPVLAWVRQLLRQVGGFLSVMLQAFGVSPRRWAAAPFDAASAAVVAGAVRKLLGKELPELSPEHRLRLEQLQRLNGRRISRNGEAGEVDA